MINRGLYKNKTAHGTAILYSSIILNILLGWLLTKLNTQYLSVEEYGQYAFFITIIYFTKSFFSIGTFESSSRMLALENYRSIKRHIFGASFIFAAFIIIPFTLFLLFFSLFSDFIFEVKIGILCFKLALFAGIVILHSYFLVTLRGSGDIAKLSLVTFLPKALYLLIIGYLIFIDNFTIFNSLFSLFIAMILSIILILYMIKPEFVNLKQRFKDIISESKQYGIHIYFGNILHEALTHSDKLLISYFLFADSMAYYGLAYMITYPLSHFSNSLATTLFNKFTSQEKINNKVLKINFSFILITVSMFIFLREPIITYLFSDEYMSAISVMLPLAMAFGFSGLSKPFTLYLMAKGQGKQVRNIAIIILILNIIMNIYLIPRFGIVGAGWATFTAYGLDFILYWYFYNQYRSKSIK